MYGKSLGFQLAQMHFVTRKNSMKRVELTQLSHNKKMGDVCPTIEPNVIDDCVFYEDNKPVGFFIRKMPDLITNLANIANNEFLSDRVPKATMDRKTPDGTDEKTGVRKYKYKVAQCSTILGSTPPKPHFLRPYPSRSSVHSVESAKVFIKAMYALAIESEKIIQELLPEQYDLQVKLFENVPKKWRFANLFTSSISNYNISAPFHRDIGNIVGAVNVIITKRNNSTGGNLNIPDYGATIDQCDNSMLVYPAWKNIHGVTPIVPTQKDGYRNSLIFYPLRAFLV
jgi:hypothetical protein